MECRLAQGVRSREEPEETFLKGVPVDPGRLEIIYPVSAVAPAVMIARSATRRMAAEIMHRYWLLNGKHLDDTVRLEGWCILMLSRLHISCRTCFRMQQHLWHV